MDPRRRLLYSRGAPALLPLLVGILLLACDDAKRTAGPSKEQPLYDKEGKLVAKHYDAPRYHHRDIEGIQDALKKDGYVVVRDIVDNEEDLAQLQASLWRSVNDVAAPGAGAAPQCGLWDGDASVQGGTMAEWMKLRELSTGYGMPWALSHSELFWRARSLPRLRSVFTDLFGTEDLIVSFDTGSVFPPAPHVEDHAGYEIVEGWLHSDQNPLWRSGRQTIQSFVTLFDQNVTTGGFVVYPGSHKFHDMLGAWAIEKTTMERCPPDRYKTNAPLPLPKVGENFIQISPEFAAVAAYLNPPDIGPDPEPVMEHARAGVRLITGLRAGDALFWDSRVAHMSSPPPYEGDGRPAYERGPWPLTPEARWLPARAVVYVSMVPRAWADDDVLLRRQQAFRDGEPCTHWPFLVDSCVGVKNPGAPVRSLLPLSPPPGVERLGGKALALVGFTDFQLEQGRELFPGSYQPRRGKEMPKPPWCDATHCYNGTKKTPHNGWGFADAGDAYFLSRWKKAWPLFWKTEIKFDDSKPKDTIDDGSTCPFSWPPTGEW